jgi:UrcA family protein
VKKILLSLGVAAALVTPALARPGEAVSRTVKTSDLNLHSEAGVHALYARIRSAAREACEGLESRSASTQVAHRECLATAMDGAVVAAKSEALTRLHMAKSSRTGAVVAAK